MQEISLLKKILYTFYIHFRFTVESNAPCVSGRVAANQLPQSEGVCQLAMAFG